MLVNKIQPNDQVNHFGTFREVLSVKAVDAGNFELTIKEDGRTVTRIENGKTELDVL